MLFVSGRLRRTASLFVISIMTGCLLSCISAGPSSDGADSARKSARDTAVQALKPAGYWPADDGKGTRLHDRSGNNNHGTIRSVAWRDGYLVFDNDFHQWIEVPHKKQFGSSRFTMGGWVYNCFDKNPQHESRSGAILIGHAFSAKRSKWGAVWGETLSADGALLRYFVPAKKDTAYLGVGSGNRNDVLGTLNKISILHSTWQHVVYTYDGSTKRGVLYVNGRKVAQADKVPFKPAKTPLVIGAGRWGTFNLGGNNSVDGTLRNMVFFDRTLTAAEVRRLCKITKPTIRPRIEPYSKRHAKRKAVYDEAVSAKQITKPTETYSLEKLVDRVQNKELDASARGRAVIQLASMGEKAKSAVPVLVSELRRMIEADGAHLPKVEEFFRNAVIRALLDIDRDDDRAKAVLSETLIKPYFETFDTTRPQVKAIHKHVESGNWFEALQTYKAHLKSLPKVKKLRQWGTYTSMKQIDEVSAIFPLGPDYFSGYLSGGVPYLDAGYSAYSLVDNRRDGTSYTTLLERVPFAEVMRVFKKELSGRTNKQPTAKSSKALGNGRKHVKEWTRVKIIKMTPDGKRQEAYLHGDWFIFDGRDEKMYGWSVITDEKGYIHLFGGQHNSPKQDNYIPGSWERLGIAKGASKASVMYWVSKEPNDITEFEFVGQANNPRKTVGSLNYMNFARNRNGRIFLYGRGDAWTWALHRYDAGRRRWHPVKGSAGAMMKRARERNPKWVGSLGGLSPYYGPADGLVTAWQPGAYNFCRTWGHLTGNDIRGVVFGPSGRMHLCLALMGVIETGEVTHRPVYAYSDDNGETFYGADGKRLALPLTHNPIPGHNADRTLESARSNFEVWVSLVREFQE